MKYLTLFLGYFLGIHILLFFITVIGGFFLGIVLIPIGIIAGAIGATVIDFNNITFSGLSTISIIFNSIVFIISYWIIYLVIKALCRRSFNTYVKKGFFVKNTFKKDLILCTIFMSILPIAIGSLYFFEDKVYKGDYTIFILVFMYIVTFYIINHFLGKKQFA